MNLKNTAKLLLILLITSCTNPLLEPILEVKTITFNTNGGSSVPQQKVIKGEKVTKPGNPVKEDYNFIGWYEDNITFLDEWNFDAFPQNDMILYVKWEEIIHPNLMPLDPPSGVSLNSAGVISFTAGANNAEANASYRFTLYKDGAETIDSNFISQSVTNGAALSGLTAKMLASTGTYSVRVWAHTANSSYSSSSTTASSANISVYAVNVTLSGAQSSEYVNNGSMNYTENGVHTFYVFGGTNVTLTAAPAASRLVTWTGDGTGTGSTRTITNVTGTINVTVIFETAGTTGLAFTSIDSGNAYSVAKGTASAAAIIIPSTYNGKPVTQIADEAFFNAASITSIVIPDGVTSIGETAFFGCSGLTSIIIPDSVSFLGVQAFWGCTGLTSITIPSGVTSISGAAFAACTNLTSVTFQGNITSIGEGAFSNTGITGISIPNSVTSIGDNAFSSCKSLISIIIPSSVSSIGNYAFMECTKLESVTFQGTIPSNSFGSAEPFPGNLRTVFYSPDSTNGTPGTYVIATPGSFPGWEKQ